MADKILRKERYFTKTPLFFSRIFRCDLYIKKLCEHTSIFLRQDKWQIVNINGIQFISYSRFQNFSYLKLKK